jgi:RING-variant domain
MTFLQRVHHACLQRWIDERELPRSNTNQALVCEICKQSYKAGYRSPPPRPTAPPRRVERVMVGNDLYVIVVDSQTGLPTATARPMRAFAEYEDAEEDFPANRQLNPVSACAISFFLFMMSSMLLSHLFTSLPGTSSTGGEPGSTIPSPMDDEEADQEFQDLSMTLLLLWLMLRLLVLIAPVYTISRMFERARLSRNRDDLSAGEAGNEGVELGVVVELPPPGGAHPV